MEEGCEVGCLMSILYEVACITSVVGLSSFDGLLKIMLFLRIFVTVFWWFVL